MTIAIVDDNPAQRQTLRETLERCGRNVVEFADGLEAWDYLCTHTEVQLVITDWMMPRLDGPGLIRLLRGANLPYYMYIILITARDGSESIVEGLGAGADDYLIKPVDRAEFLARVAVGERILSLERRLRQARDEQRFYASHDLLTRVLNRRALHEQVAQLYGGPGPFSLLIGDIDHFKSINDRFGHSIGDQALQMVARALRASVRTGDFVARWGGEEFAILLPHTDHELALKIAERIRQTVANLRLIISDTVRVDLSLSIGAASLDRLNEKFFEQLLHSADTALYKAKTSGRNQVRSAINQKIVPNIDEHEIIDTDDLPELPIVVSEPVENHVKPDLRELARMIARENPTALISKDQKQLRHDVRSRFSGLIGMSELLLETELDAEQQHAAAKIHAASRALLQMVEELLRQQSGEE